MPEIPAEAPKTCQAWDMGYPRECTQRARYRATRHQALPFDLCSQHLNRAWRAGYQVCEISAVAGERLTPTPAHTPPEATESAQRSVQRVVGSTDPQEASTALSAARIREALRDPANHAAVAEVLRREARVDPSWMRQFIARENRAQGGPRIGRAAEFGGIAGQRLPGRVAGINDKGDTRER